MSLAALVIGQYFFNPVYAGKALNEGLVQEIAVNAVAQLPARFYVFNLLAFLTPFAIIGVPFYANRWFVFPLLRKLVAKALKNSPNEPLKVIFILYFVMSFAKAIYCGIFK